MNGDTCAGNRPSCEAGLEHAQIIWHDLLGTAETIPQR